MSEGLIDLMKGFGLTGFQGIGGVCKTPPFIALPDIFDARYGNGEATSCAPSGVLSPLGGLVWRTPLVGLEAAEIGTHRNLVRSVVGTDNHIGLRPLL